jgi:hypothetical protein
MHCAIFQNKPTAHLPFRQFSYLYLVFLIVYISFGRCHEHSGRMFTELYTTALRTGRLQYASVRIDSMPFALLLYVHLARVCHYISTDIVTLYLV